MRREFNKIKANIGFREEVIRKKKNKKTRYYYVLPRVKAKEKDGK